MLAGDRSSYVDAYSRMLGLNNCFYFVVGRGGARQQTDVVTLEADLLEVVTESDKHWASVRFSGTVRETPDTEPVGFEEVWNLVKPADGSSGWLLAGIQQMH